VSEARATSAPKRYGEYEVLAQLSSGGMGEVLLARKRAAGGFDKLVAIKTIRSDLRSLDQLRAMFLDEARLMSRLTHPAVAQVYDFGEQDGTLFLVMEYVTGFSFGELAETRIEPGVACRAMALACRGLHAAHELKDAQGVPLGVVHRDVSPDNLMLTFDGSVSVLDFGIALMRNRHAPVTDYGTIKGKPPYLSPELVKGETVDRRSDVFSASAVLFEMLTGEPLFSGGSIYEAGLAVLERDIPKITDVLPELDAAFDDVLGRGLERDREQRYQSALALAEGLDGVASKLGTESLSSYATREFAAAKDEHEIWLARLRGGEATGPVGRETGIVTAIGDAALESTLAEFAERTTQAALAPTEEHKHSRPIPGSNDAEPKSDLNLDKPARSTWPLLLLGVLAIGALVIGWRLFGMGPEDDNTDAGALAQVPTDSTPADASIPVRDDAAIATATVDASLSPDAAPSVDAGRRRVDRDRKRRRDAGTRMAVRPDARSRTADAAPAVTGTGFITMVADPFASVRIDGVEKRSTPIFNMVVPAGRHVIELVSPESGRVRVRKVINVKPNQRYRVEAPK